MCRMICSLVLFLVSSPLFADVIMTGVATVKVNPDAANVELSIVTEHIRAKNALAENALTSKSVIKALTDLGIKEADIQTSYFDFRPKYNYPRGQQPQFVAFEVVHRLTVCVKDISKIGETIDSAVFAGVTRVNSLRFKVLDPTKAFNQARVDAVTAAKNKAVIYAKAAGITLGKIKTLTEQRASAGGTAYPLTRSISQTIMTGQIGLTVTVVITWEN